MKAGSILRCLNQSRKIMSLEIVTFGCRLNAFESEVVRVEAARAGLTETVVINSCAVTSEAVAQARQSIRRLKRERPEVRIVVTGCAAQTQAEMFAGMAEVDRVVGNDDKMRGETWRVTRAAFDAGENFGVAATEKIAVADIMAVREMAPHLLAGFQNGLPRVFVQVQNGCEHPGLRLRGAAGDDDPGRGPLALQPADRLPRLRHGFIGHRAAIDDDGVGQPGALGLPRNHLGFEGVEAAAKGDDLDAHLTRRTQTAPDRSGLHTRR